MSEDAHIYFYNALSSYSDFVFLCALNKIKEVPTKVLTLKYLIQFPHLNSPYVLSFESLLTSFVDQILNLFFTIFFGRKYRYHDLLREMFPLYESFFGSKKVSNLAIICEISHEGAIPKWIVLSSEVSVSFLYLLLDVCLFPLDFLVFDERMVHFHMLTTTRKRRVKCAWCDCLRLERVGDCSKRCT